jgi:16S rRNA (cytosine967-C5)-methyltransferase
VDGGRPFDLALNDALAGLADADRRLAHELAAGTLRAAGVLDTSIAPYVRDGWEHVPPRIRNLLRLGAYQLTALDRIPPHAAVATTVSLAREVAGARTAGFVNAVLRRVAEEAPRVVPGRASHPGWLVSRWTARFGPEDAAKLMTWNDTRPRLVTQPARWSAEEQSAKWQSAKIEFEGAPYDAGLIPLLGTRAGHGPAPTEGSRLPADVSRLTSHVSRLQDLPGYSEGGWFVQDVAQALVIRYFRIPAGSVIYDAAAAPGGKTMAMGRTARAVIAGDLRRDRVKRLRENLTRAGSGREYPIVADASEPPVRPVDAVVLDAPCLGTGVLARHPEARWRVNEDALGRLVAASRDLLHSLAPVVRPGGLLCFSTCSLEPEENEMQIEEFLRDDPRFRREPSRDMPADLLSPSGDLTLLPQRHQTDGAYAARLRRHA